MLIFRFRAERGLYSQRLINSIGVKSIGDTISQESSLALQALYNNYYHDNVIAAAELIAN